MHATSGVFGHEKALFIFLRLNSSSSSKYAASKIFTRTVMGNNFEFLYGSYYTYVSALIVFVVTLTIQYYYCIRG